jgi:hypothetical protein
MAAGDDLPVPGHKQCAGENIAALRVSGRQRGVAYQIAFQESTAIVA